MNMAAASASPPASPSPLPGRPEKLRLGDVLVQQRLISQDQLQQTLELQRQTGKKVGRLLIESGVITEELLANGLARQLRIPFVNLKTFPFRADLVKLLAESAARRFRALVLEDKGDTLLVALADPLDLFAFDELTRLREAGLSMVYVGAESGDDTVLDKVSKGETFESTCSALDKLAEAGIKRSVMILNGLGGEIYSEQHALESARLINATQPEYLATLVVSFPSGEQRFREGFAEWSPLSQHGLFLEMEKFIGTLELRRTVFRSDHASNWLILKGTLGADKNKLLQQVRSAIDSPQSTQLRPAWARGL